MFELYFEDDFGEHYIGIFDNRDDAENEAEYIRDEYGNVSINIVEVDA